MAEHGRTDSEQRYFLSRFLESVRDPKTQDSTFPHDICKECKYLQTCAIHSMEPCFAMISIWVEEILRLAPHIEDVEARETTQEGMRLWLNVVKTTKAMLASIKQP